MLGITEGMSRSTRLPGRAEQSGETSRTLDSAMIEPSIGTPDVVVVDFVDEEVRIREVVDPKKDLWLSTSDGLVALFLKALAKLFAPVIIITLNRQFDVRQANVSNHILLLNRRSLMPCHLLFCSFSSIALQMMLPAHTFFYSTNYRKFFE